ncbi:hypothetical protein [Halodurantibacterium flavum]|uniref:Uncharacterized protein n=1 Tax=Halodurantibacterium flavum TaxID=1382802 RepID=A0ABW4S566_9RHOB
MQLRALSLAAALVLPATAVFADCDSILVADTCVAPVNTIATEAVLEEPVYEVGDTLPIYDYNILINPEYYGLPVVNGHWRYYRVNGDIFRVHAGTAEILERVTEQSALLR